jgi:hypothetical protein
MLERKLKDPISAAIYACAEWEERTAGAPDGFVGEFWPVPEEEVTTETRLEEAGDQLEDLVDEIDEALPHDGEDESPYTEGQEGT